LGLRAREYFQQTLAAGCGTPAPERGRSNALLPRDEQSRLESLVALAMTGGPATAGSSVGRGWLAGHHITAALDTPDRCFRWVILWIKVSGFTEFAPVGRGPGHGMENGDQLRPVRDLIIIGRHEEGPCMRK
jgi:hypothetical protein